MGTSVLLGRAGTCSGEAAALCPAAQASQGRGVPLVCQAKSIPEQVTVQPALRTSYLCKDTTENWKWKLPEKRVHVPSAYFGRQALPLGSSWTAQQTSSRSLVLITPQQAELQRRRSH